LRNVRRSQASLDGKLRWKCRRGVRELDILLTGFLQFHYDGLSLKERADFERLLDTQDPVIMEWLYGYKQAPDEEMAQLLGKIRESSMG
jgi:antitoxin CptB